MTHVVSDLSDEVCVTRHAPKITILFATVLMIDFMILLLVLLCDTFYDTYSPNTYDTYYDTTRRKCMIDFMILVARRI